MKERTAPEEWRGEGQIKEKNGERKGERQRESGSGSVDAESLDVIAWRQCKWPL